MTGREWPSAARAVLTELTGGLSEVLGVHLVGVYAFGSLVTGDFDPDVSDLDVLAVLASDLTDESFARLDQLHAAVLAGHPQWTDRLEVIYFTATALASFRGMAHPIAVISPGEPFNVKVAEEDWNSNWYVVREHGVALLGPDPKTLIPPIEVAEVTAQQRELALGWVSSVGPASHPGAVAYRVLTACRALFASERGTMTSKSGAAQWAQAEMPEWADLIADAQQVRLAGGWVGSIDLGRVREFLSYATDRLRSRQSDG